MLVDCGDFTGSQTATAKARGLFLLEMMGRLGYDAINVGAGDLKLGRDLLEALASEEERGLLSANLLDAETGQTVFPTRRIVEKSGVRIGITGALLPAVGSKAAAEKAGLVIGDVEESVRGVLEELRRETDVVVFLASGGLRDVRAIGERLHGLADVVVIGSASGGRGIVQPEHGGAVYVTMGPRGQAVGLANLGLVDGRVDRLIGDELTLFGDLAEDPEVIELVSNFEGTLNDLMKSHFVEEARARAAPDGHEFLGARVCSDCHLREFEIWLETPHAWAFQTLMSADRESLPECYGCHVTGHGDPTGYVPGPEGFALANVQCEVCHDKGTRHRRDGSYGLPLLMDACSRCHDSENSPDFDRDAYWLMIEH